MREGNTFTHQRPPAPNGASPAVVYVAGEVIRPGVYRISSAARVDDAVRAAGGLRGDADAVAVNLAARIEDGEEIAVPKVGETARRAFRAAGLRSGIGRRRRRNVRQHGIVELNGASARELAGVPGIGAAIAARIVEIRATEGPFQTLDELLDVAGVTQSRLDRAAPYLRI
jgi:competence protein ComEA